MARTYRSGQGGMSGAKRPMSSSMVHDPVLDEFLQKIAPVRTRIKQLLLFGSRARGDHHVASDYDVLVVVTQKDARLIEVLYDAVMDVLLAHGRLVSLKIFPEHEFERLTRLQTPFMRRVMAEGVPLG